MATSIVQEDTAATQANSPITPNPWTPPDPAYKISVIADGIHLLRYNDLLQAGLPVNSINPLTFHMFYMGREIAIQVQGEADGQFDPGDAILFYGRSVDSLYYEGRLPDHKYTDTNIYWLSYGEGNGKRMVLKDGTQSGIQPATLAKPFLQTIHQEEQKLYVTEYPRYPRNRFDPTEDHWFWHKLQVFGEGGVRTRQYTFPLEHVSTGNYTGTVSAHVVGGYDNAHGIRLLINGHEVFADSTSWIDFESFTATGVVSQSFFIEGNNVLQVEVSNVTGFISEVYIDWVELSYHRNHVASNDQLLFDGTIDGGPWRYIVDNFSLNDILVYDVTDLDDVQLIANTVITGTGPYTVEFEDSEPGRHYLAVTPTRQRSPAGVEQVNHLSTPYTPSSVGSTRNNVDYSLLDTRNGADWIVITHTEFWDAILPLSEYRARKYRVAQVDVQEIYDQFNGGLRSAESIRDFLEYAYHNWQPPAPRFVLLAGGGTNDMRNYFSNSKPTYIPAYLYPSDPILGETASDNRFVTFIGDDILPDMHLGRFPAYTPNEITILVNKIFTYEATPTVNAWNTNVLLISDDLEGGGGNFYEFSDIIAHGSADPVNPEETKFLPEPYTPHKVYLGRTCDLNNPSFAAECRADIAEIINDEGALIVSYVGHAQTKNWAIEKLMDLTLANSLTNYNKLSIFLGMACFEGFFHESPLNSRSLGETYIFNPNGGAVASWSPTGFGVATGHDWLEQGLFLALFQDNITHLGAAMTQGKEYLAHNAPPHKYDDLIDTFNLFGDPALQVQSFVAPTAVEMTEFEAHVQGNGVSIEWETQTEVDIQGFHLLRSEAPDGPFVALNSEPILAQSPGGNHGFRYDYLDRTVQSGGSYWYRLEILKLDGTKEKYGLIATDFIAINNVEIFLPIMVR